MGAAIHRVAALPEGFTALAREAWTQSFHALERMQQHFADGTNRFDRPGEGLWAAVDGERLVGTCGLNVDPYVDDPRCGRLRHLYVALDARHRGVGRALVEAALAHARKGFDRVRVRTGDEEALRFYDALGLARADGADRATASHVFRLAP